jgi:transcriptional regulator with XRE-family HTH domain
MDDHAKRVGERIRDRRIARGLTQKRAAQLAGVGSTLWGQLERGEPGDRLPLVLGKVSVALGWPPKTLELMLTDPSYEPPTDAQLREGAERGRRLAERRVQLKWLGAVIRQRLGELGVTTAQVAHAAGLEEDRLLELLTGDVDIRPPSDAEAAALSLALEWPWDGASRALAGAPIDDLVEDIPTPAWHWAGHVTPHGALVFRETRTRPPAAAPGTPAARSGDMSQVLDILSEIRAKQEEQAEELARLRHDTNVRLERVEEALERGD